MPISRLRQFDLQAVAQPQLELPPPPLHSTERHLVVREEDDRPAPRGGGGGATPPRDTLPRFVGMPRPAKRPQGVAWSPLHLPEVPQVVAQPAAGDAAPISHCLALAGTALSASCDAGALLLHSTTTDGPAPVLYDFSMPSRCVAVAADGASKFVAALFADTGLMVVPLEDGTPMVSRRRRTPQWRPGRQVGVHPTLCNTSHVWNLTVQGARSLHVSPNGRWLGLIDRHHKFRVVSSVSLEFHRPIDRPLFTASLAAFAWSPSGGKVACATTAGDIIFLGSRDLNELRRFTVEPPVSRLLWLAAAEQLLAVTPAGIRVFDAEAMEVWGFIDGSRGVDLFAAAPAGNLLAVAVETMVHFLQPPTFKQLPHSSLEVEAPVTALDWGLDGLLVGLQSGALLHFA